MYGSLPPHHCACWFPKCPLDPLGSSACPRPWCMPGALVPTGCDWHRAVLAHSRTSHPCNLLLPRPCHLWPTHFPGAGTFDELHEVHVTPFLYPVQVPLKSSTRPWCINFSSQFCRGCVPSYPPGH